MNVIKKACDGMCSCLFQILKEETTTLITKITPTTTGSTIIMLTIHYQMWELFGRRIMIHFFLRLFLTG